MFRSRLGCQLKLGKEHTGNYALLSSHSELQFCRDEIFVTSANLEPYSCVRIEECEGAAFNYAVVAQERRHYVQMERKQ